MTSAQRVEQLIARAPWVAVALYPALVALFVFVAAATLVDLGNRRDTLSAAQDILQQVEGRSWWRAVTMQGGTDVAVPAGSPFLEGSTISVAGAALLQRLTGAITRVGGNILSSQVDLQASPSKPLQAGLYHRHRQFRTGWPLPAAAAL